MSLPNTGTELRSRHGWLTWAGAALAVVLVLAVLVSIPTYQVRNGVGDVGDDVRALAALDDRTVTQTWDCNRFLFTIEVDDWEHGELLTAEAFTELEALGYVKIERRRTQRERDDTLDLDIVEVERELTTDRQLVIYAAVYDTDSSVCIPDALAP